MKSEERHKLHQNALAVWLAQTFTTIKPYQNIILGGVIVVILAVIATTWWTNESAASANMAWTKYFSALDQGNSSALEKVAEDNPRSHAAPAANLVAADVMLAQGCNMLFINKALANQQLNNAVILYQKAREQTKLPALLAQATFGLARTRESQGKLDMAVELYTEVTTNWPDTAFAKMSSQRSEDLKRASTREIYDKFAQFDPKPAFSQQSGEKPNFDQMPEESPISTFDTLKKQGVEEKKTEEKDGDKAESKPDEKTEKPVDTQQVPKSEKPAP